MVRGYPSAAPPPTPAKPLVRLPFPPGRTRPRSFRVLRPTGASARFRALFPTLLVAGALLACGGGPDDGPSGRPADFEAPGTETRSAPAPAAIPPPAEAPADERPAIVAFGDSLTAGYRLEIEEAWPARLQERLDEAGIGLRVVNAGVSGETSSGGLRRLPWVLDRQPGARFLVLALGGNDGLRGVPASVMTENLLGMIREAEGRGLSVLLAGVPTAPELGPDYAEEFRDAFRGVARDTGTPLLENLLEGVAGDPELNLPDRIHPNEAGARLLAGNVFAALGPLLPPPAGGLAASSAEPSPR